MSTFDIKIPGGESRRLLTAGKYCDRDILVTAEGGGFMDGNLTFTEHVVTVTDGNGVKNHGTLIDYFFSIVGDGILAYSLIGIADTYDQAICGVPGIYNTSGRGFGYRYRNGYQLCGTDMWQAPRNFNCIVVTGTQYKVYTANRIE